MEGNIGNLLEDGALTDDFYRLVQHSFNINDERFLNIIRDHRQHEEFHINSDDSSEHDSNDYSSDSTYEPSNHSNSQDDNDPRIMDLRDLVLHDPIDDDDHYYVGPLDNPVQYGECDCNFYNNNMNQCLLLNRSINWLNINFDEEYEDAKRMYEANEHREPNNIQRKRMYREIWGNLSRDLEFEDGENRYSRIKLPNCSYALVRMIWPSSTGRYMGFREH